ncbi:alkaline phosphatase family protein [Haloferacaceae archaeon DSL9]
MAPDASANPRAQSVDESARSDGPEYRRRTFVLGLDGVPWDRIESWIEDGALPNFAALARDGAAGPLTSTTPASTPLAWPSIATGTWPDKHGVYWFQRLHSDYTHTMNTSDNVGRPALWEYLSPAVVGNVPMTYPAREIDGILAAGMMSPGVKRGWAHPPSLVTTVEERIPEYRIGLDWSEYADKETAFRTDLESLVEARRELMRLLMETTDWGLFFFVYTAPDRLQHLIWDESVLLEHYQLLDDILGEVMAYVDRFDGNLFVVSDHGFGPLSKSISLPRVLESAGYLRRQDESGTRGHLARLGITKQSVHSWLDAVGIDDRTVIDYLPQALVDMVAMQVPGTHALYDVDYEDTVAFAHGSGNVYVNDAGRFENGCVPPERIPAIKRELEAVFGRVTDPESGAQVLEVFDGDDLFPTDDRSPDLVVKGIPGYETLTMLTDDVFVDAGEKAAGHRSEGIVLARGPDIEPGSAPTGATVVDVAPTILRTAGRSIPTDLDGRVLEEILTDESLAAEPRTESRRGRSTEASGTEAAGGPTQPTDRPDRSDEAHESVESRLRGLGYIE